jgi:hypothetical protein
VGNELVPFFFWFVFDRNGHPSTASAQCVRPIQKKACCGIEGRAAGCRSYVPSGLCGTLVVEETSERSGDHVGPPRARSLQQQQLLSKGRRRRAVVTAFAEKRPQLLLRIRRKCVDVGVESN